MITVTVRTSKDLYKRIDAYLKNSARFIYYHNLGEERQLKSLKELPLNMLVNIPIELYTSLLDNYGVDKE